VILIRNSILISGGAALLIGSLPLLIFSLTLVPLGIAFSFSLFNKLTPVQAGFRGSLVLGASWFIFWLIFGIVYKANPYVTLLTELDQGLVSGLAQYQESADMAPDTLESIRKAVELIRVYIPKVLPALLVSVILSTTWLNLALGNWLLKKNHKDLSHWPDFKDWQLPESLVWGVVFGGVTVILLPAPLSILGLNILIICGIIFFFQGLAIVSSLLFKWSVPRPFRILIYGLIFIQTYGIILLSVVGLADVWADFRKLNQPAENQEESE
jgi:uncharacterized protein YybS (DUF2232 family)